MGSAPGLLPPLRDGIPCRQIGHALVGIFYLGLGMPPPDALLEDLPVFRFDDADDPAKARLHRIVDRIINDELPVGADRFSLLQPAVAAAQPRGHNDKCRFLHIIFSFSGILPGAGPPRRSAPPAAAPRGLRPPRPPGYAGRAPLRGVSALCGLLLPL